MSKDSRVKILYIITDLSIGGAEQLLLLTLKNINRQRFIPTVCCFRAGELASEIKSLDIEVVDLGIHTKLELINLIKLCLLLKKEKFDIVHTHLFHANVVGRIAAHFFRIPVVVSTLHYAFSYNGKFGAALEKLTAGFADYIIVVSGAAKNFCIDEIGISGEKLKLIYNGIDLSMDTHSFPGKKSLREQLCLSNEFIVGCIGRFDKVKGHRYLLKAAAEIITDYNKIKFILVGSGTLEKDLKKLAGELGISNNVIFLPNRRDIPEVLDSFDIYVLPSLQEGLSITLLEAASRGKPVIVTAVGGNPEVIVDNNSGILVPPKNHKALAQAIINLYKNKDMAKQLGMNAKKRTIEMFDIKANVNKTESLYEQVLIRKKGNYA